MKTTKLCFGCQKEKSLEEFGRHSRTSGYQSYCKICNKEHSKLWYRKNSSRHRKRVRENKKILKMQKTQFILNYLKEHPCVVCGELDPIVLEFDHLNKKTKYMNVSHMVSDAFGLDRIKEEIEKCQVLCANCHRRKSAGENGSWRLKLHMQNKKHKTHGKDR